MGAKARRRRKYPWQREVNGFPITYRAGDRVTMLFGTAGLERRYVGTVASAPYPLYPDFSFEVDWDGGAGRARFVHGGEPASFRFATDRDEGEMSTIGRFERAAELRSLMQAHTDWPTGVLAVLRTRLYLLTGGQ